MCAVARARIGIVKVTELSEFTEKLLGHSAHPAGRSGLAVGSEVLDNHRKNGGKGHLDDLRGDAGFLGGFLDEAGATESLSNLFGSRCGSLT